MVPVAWYNVVKLGPAPCRYSVEAESSTWYFVATCFWRKFKPICIQLKQQRTTQHISRFMIAPNVVSPIYPLCYVQTSVQNAHPDWSPNQTIPQPKVLKCRVHIASMSISVLYPSCSFTTISCKKERITCLKMVCLHPAGPTMPRNTTCTSNSPESSPILRIRNNGRNIYSTLTSTYGAVRLFSWSIVRYHTWPVPKCRSRYIRFTSEGSTWYPKVLEGLYNCRSRVALSETVFVGTPPLSIPSCKLKYWNAIRCTCLNPEPKSVTKESTTWTTIFPD